MPENLKAKGEKESNILDKFAEKKKSGKDLTPDEDDEGSKQLESSGKANMKTATASIDAEASDKELNILNGLFEKKQDEDTNNSSDEDDGSVRSNDDRDLGESLEGFEDVDEDTLMDSNFWEYYIIDALEMELGFDSLEDGSLENEINYIKENFIGKDCEKFHSSLKEGINNLIDRFEEFKKSLEGSD